MEDRSADCTLICLVIFCESTFPQLHNSVIKQWRNKYDCFSSTERSDDDWKILPTHVFLYPFFSCVINLQDCIGKQNIYIDVLLYNFSLYFILYRAFSHGHWYTQQGTINRYLILNIKKRIINKFVIFFTKLVLIKKYCKKVNITICIGIKAFILKNMYKIKVKLIIDWRLHGYPIRNKRFYRWTSNVKKT